MDRATTLTGFFRDLVRSAIKAQGLRTSETIEHYLVHLLEGFTRPQQADLLDPPLAVDYLVAGHLPPQQRYEKLKRVADTALFVIGVFADSLDRSAVGPDYYATIGRTAYDRLAHDPHHHRASAVFGELAGRFPDCVGVLMEVSENDIFHREQDTVRLYRRWLHTGGRREAELLMRRGLLPIKPGRQRPH